jgi:hypothetical protein
VAGRARDVQSEGECAHLLSPVGEATRHLLLPPRSKVARADSFRFFPPIPNYRSRLRINTKQSTRTRFIVLVLLSFYLAAFDLYLERTNMGHSSSKLSHHSKLDRSAGPVRQSYAFPPPSPNPSSPLLPKTSFPRRASGASASSMAPLLPVPQRSILLLRNVRVNKRRED